MAYASVLSDIPDQITAGESVSWKKSLSDFPASNGWAITYVLVKDGTQITLPVSTADGNTHVIEVPFGTSAGYTAGEYRYAAYVSNGTERYTVDEGNVEIVVDFATQVSGFDARSHLRKVLDLLEATIEGRASKTQLEHEIAGVKIKHMTLDELMNARDRYKARLRKRPDGEALTETIKPCIQW